MLALGLSLLLFVFWTLVGQAVFAALKLRLGVLRSWLLAPGVGLSVVVVALMIFNQAGWPIGKFARPLTGLLGGAALGVFCWRRPLMPWRQFAPFLAAIVFALGWAGWPAGVLGFHWLSYVNDDFVNYCLAADRFRDCGFFDLPKMADLIGRDYSQYYWFMHVVALIRFGSEHLLAWTAADTGRRAIEIFMPVIMALGLVQLSATAGLVLQKGRWRRRACLAAVLLSFSPLFMLGSLYQLIAQVGGLGLMMTVLALLTVGLPSRTNRRRILPLAFVLALTASALCVYYPEVSPFPGLALLVFVGVELLQTRRFPAARLALVAYAALLIFVLLRYNVIAYIYTLAVQFASGTRVVDLSLSLFPYFLIPTGLANLFGLLPIAYLVAEPYGSFTILTAVLLLLAAIGVMTREILRPAAFACLLFVQLLLAFRLFAAGSDFGLYKIAMFMQPGLMAALACLLLKLPRPRLAIPLAVVLLFIGCLTAGRIYTVSSLGLKSGGLTEMQLASKLLDQPLPATGPGEHWLSSVDNVAAAKLAAILYRGTDIKFLSKDFFWTVVFLHEDTPGLAWYPHPENFRLSHELLRERDRSLYGEHFLFHSQFSMLRPQAGVTAFLTLPPELSLFNKLHPRGSAPLQLFRKQTVAETQNLLVFVHSSRGHHYFLGDRQVISFFQQEQDTLAKTGDFNGIGRFLLLRVEKPTDPLYLRFSGTKTVLGRDNTAWSKVAAVEGATTTPLRLVGNGAVNRIVGPLRPVWVDGAAYIALDFHQTPIAFPFKRYGLQALYNTYISIDYRRLIGFGRDISALSPDEYVALERPRRVASFPRDLTSATGLEFSGIFEDGWVSPEAEFTLGEAQPGDVVRLKGYIPQLPGQTADAAWSVSVNGGAPTRLDAGIGSFDWLFPVAQPAKMTRISLRFTSASALPAGDDRPVGAKLDLIEVAPPPSPRYDFATVGATRLTTQGIDQDGWAQTAAHIALPASVEPARLEVVLEYPGWAGAAPTEIQLALDDAPATARPLKPGPNLFTLELPVSATPRTLNLQASRAFTLPAPDGRSRSYRLVSLEQIPAPAPEPLRATHVDLTAAPAAPSLTSGIDADGWAQASTNITVPAATNSARLDLIVEYPGWAGAPEAGLRLTLEGNPEVLHPLKPGRNTLSVSLAPSLRARRLHLEATQTFRLPAPDGRERAFRALSLDLVPDPNPAKPEP
jgi:hypothetical protein